LSGGKVTLPTLVLLNKLPAKERDELLEEIRGRRAPPLERRRALMSAHGVFAEVVVSVRAELEAGVALLAPWAHLEPAPLLVQLLGLLQDQVNNLSGGETA
jgi:octaprenyl-diphosphate synthase